MAEVIQVAQEEMAELEELEEHVEGEEQTMIAKRRNDPAMPSGLYSEERTQVAPQDKVAAGGIK